MADEVLAKSFELIGTEYDRYRPGFPAAAVDVLCPHPARAALDLGAGTGKFTELLADRAERVSAVEPSPAMISVLRSKLPDVDAMLGSAELIPVESGSIDLVTVAQAFHWFDREPACAEIARVLVSGGALGLIWNHSDPECPWDRAAHRIAHPAVAASDDTTSSAGEELPGFEFVRREQIRWVERIRRDAYLKRWSTVSTFLVADDATRAEMSAQIEAVLDADPQTHGRTELDLPVVTDVYLYRSL
ncbi:ubiquinone/menaquinone biosynthesis C-methylase UbiE [Microbacterium foliorum]|uniref:class I SAM-dependent methyltransferase n=1 Tax=Microbacterium foliorum TaxID=104336 RepID=UPI00209E9378|nr:class I SAM-dependent methyltransferase [Microbacterium foliorum]MCP1429795.1 ubiquinone/menaquinone biosynthesis C-methylase UbiE [Microbacterium foliorum]